MASFAHNDLRDDVARFFEQELAKAEGFEVRHSQQEMAEAVSETLSNGGRLAVEAETGTGKSLAYLVPLLLSATSQGRRAVIATKTLQLQDQLMHKELPFLQTRLDSPRKVVQARGWSNYLCLHKVESPSEETVRELGEELPQLRARAHRSGGKLTRQDVSTSSARWARVQADALDCRKHHCSHFSRCGLFAERRELEDADIILTNHAFLLSDLKVRREGGGLLPPCDILVLDEAHRLDDAATDHLTIRVDNERFHTLLTAPRQGWLESVRFAMLAHLPEAHLLDWTSKFDLHVVLAMQELEQLGSNLLAELASLGRHRIGSTILPALLAHSDGESVANLASELTFGLEGLTESLSVLAERYLELSSHEPPAELARLARALQGLTRDLEFLLTADHKDWVFLCDFHPPALLARPVDNALTLHSELFSGFSSVVATSATLKVNGTFDFFFQRSGFALEPSTHLSLESPFQAAQATFVGLANSGLAPNEDGYAEALAPSLCLLASGLAGRTFLLTTSFRSLTDFARLLEEPLRESGVQLLVQGQAPPGQLLRRFTSPGAHVLLGVDTFWEGVDISGERLSCVVLTRVPFPVPTDPLFEARCRRIEEQGGNAFQELSLPLAALKLKQGFGRLLRSSKDRGVFLLLDPRIGRRAYGKTLSHHLPGGHAHFGHPEDLVEEALQWAGANLS